MAKFLIISIFIFVIVVTPVKAQRVVEDYIYQYEKYGKVYDNFKLSRDKYKTYDVLSSRNEAVEAARALILQRNQVLRTWLLALKNKVRNTPGVVEVDGGLFGQMDRQIVWLEENSEEISSLQTPSFEDLFVLSDRVEEKEAEFMRSGYQTLAEVLLGKIRTLNSESVALTTLLSEEISKSENATRAAELDLWLKEVRVKNYLAGKEIEAAEINLANLKSTSRVGSLKNYYTNLKIDVDDTKLYLEQALSYQKEIMGELK
jgi:hypothetical protein